MQLVDQIGPVAAARYLLAHQDEIAKCVEEKRWDDLIALAEFVRHDAPRRHINEDPVTFIYIRQQITEYYLRGWSSALDLRHLREEARKAIAGKAPGEPGKSFPGPSPYPPLNPYVPRRVRGSSDKRDSFGGQRGHNEPDSRG